MKFTGYQKESKPLQEGPMDFIKGATREIGSKVKQSAPVRAAADVVRAGRQASEVGEFSKRVQQFAQLLVQRDQLRGAPQDEQPREQPQERQPQQAEQQPQSAGGEQRGTPDAFRTSSKPKGRMGQHGFEYTFDSFLQATHGDRVDEGVWDFVKGAGGAVADKMREKIQQYGDKPSILKDIYNAGAAAHRAGQERRSNEQFEQIDAKAKALLGELRQQAQSLGPNANEVVKQALAKMPPQLQQRVMQLIFK